MFGSFFDVVLQTVKAWNPPEYSSEGKYRDHLQKFLMERLNHSGSGVFSSPIWGFDSSGQHVIKKEHDKGLADIGIDNKIGIELKLNLRHKSEMNRLVGQVVDDLSRYTHLIIVLCGQTEQETIDYLKQKLGRIVTQSSSPFGQEKLIRIVSKDKSQNPKKEKNPFALF